jgi:hypothetical protein
MRRVLHISVLLSLWKWWNKLFMYTPLQARASKSKTASPSSQNIRYARYLEVVFLPSHHQGLFATTSIFRILWRRFRRMDARYLECSVKRAGPSLLLYGARGQLSLYFCRKSLSLTRPLSLFYPRHALKLTLSKGYSENQDLGIPRPRKIFIRVCSYKHGISIVSDSEQAPICSPFEFQNVFSAITLCE